MYSGGVNRNTGIGDVSQSSSQNSQASSCPSELAKHIKSVTNSVTLSQEPPSFLPGNQDLTPRGESKLTLPPAPREDDLEAGEAMFQAERNEAGAAGACSAARNTDAENGLELTVKKRLVALSIQDPAQEPRETADKPRKSGVFLSPHEVYSILRYHNAKSVGKCLNASDRMSKGFQSPAMDMPIAAQFINPDARPPAEHNRRAWWKIAGEQAREAAGDQFDEAALRLISGGQPILDSAVEQAVVAFALKQPAHEEEYVSKELSKRGILLSAGEVRSIWLRHNLESFSKRLKTFGQMSTGFPPKLRQMEVLTPAQLKTLKLSKEAKLRKARSRLKASTSPLSNR